MEKLLIPTIAFLIAEFFEEALCGAFWFAGSELGGKREEAVRRVVGDLGDGLCELFAWVGPGQIAAGDLEAVEEQAGPAGVDLVGGDSAKDLADGELDAGAIGEVAGVGKDEVGVGAGLGGGVAKTDGAVAGLGGTAGLVLNSDCISVKSTLKKL